MVGPTHGPLNPIFNRSRVLPVHGEGHMHTKPTYKIQRPCYTPKQPSCNATNLNQSNNLHQIYSSKSMIIPMIQHSNPNPATNIFEPKPDTTKNSLHGSFQGSNSKCLSTCIWTRLLGGWSQGIECCVKPMLVSTSTLFNKNSSDVLKTIL